MPTDFETSHIETLAVHAGRETDPDTGAITPSIRLATTFERDADGQYRRGYDYIRDRNPGRAALEQCLRRLEGGAAAAAFGSGTAATLAVFQTLERDAHIIASRDSYHGTVKQLQEVVARWGIQITLVDTSDLDAVRSALSRKTQLIWCETPSNPLLKVSDLAGLASLAAEHGQKLVCDNTFATPVLQQPLALGAHAVVHSTTKYMGGHGDLMGGAVVTAREDEFVEAIRAFRSRGGAVPSPFDCWLLLRSLCTLPYRVRAQCESARHVAEFLASHEAIATVHYPGLPTDPGHALASRQMRAGGAVLSFRVRGGEAAAMGVAARVKLFARATSLGGVESLIEHRASIEGSGTLAP